MPKITIDNTEIEVETGTSILQAAEQLGIEIPRFCYHDRLSVPANCRMCLVEVEGGPPKPVASCAMACGEGMKVKTDSDMVKKARKGVMEMLLINHPLDCPICDQGGECDLQDQAMGYGFDRSRFHENKRAVPDKDLGPLIKTSMNRCINCTRCVRFAEEIAGTPVLGQFHRGEDAEIGTFIHELVGTELSGNLIDVCPVGALTSKPYAFKARPWELRKTESIDVHDALGSAIRIDARGREVMRILPRLNEDINEEWIDDRTRFSYDGLNKGRLDRPWIRDPDTGKLREASWDEALSYTAHRMEGIQGHEIAALAGDLADVESMVALKDLMTALGSPHLDCRTDGALFDVAERTGYLFNSTIAGIEQADAILLVGTNPRLEGVMVNARIRKAWRDKRVKIGLIGEEADLTYPYKHLGTGSRDLDKISEFFSGAERPLMIVGAGVFARPDGLALHHMMSEMAQKSGAVKEGWNGFNILHRAASRVGALETGFMPGKNGKAFEEIIQGTRNGSVKALYLLGADEFDARSLIGWQTFTIYQGHHGDRGAARADVVLPGAAYSEKDGIYVNTEGRPQMARRASFPPGDAKEDWKILRALSETLGKTLPYDTQAQLRARLFKEWPNLADFGVVHSPSWAAFGEKGKIAEDAFENPVKNFYLANAICRASGTMKACSEAFVQSQSRPYAEAAE
ncbi:MAG: NADH-quinone oxidoreductase subunit NuoG [Alphaproteobacteria bacterium]|nr:NADH-quinone oxidoreductase subunit NuoG [Alphaproteobacteria bacterium]